MTGALLESLDGVALKDVFTAYRDVLEEHRDFLNRVNVYPVADGDTGTNMLVTVRSALDAVDDAVELGEVASRLAHGAVMGGRGNSGIILSQIVKGLLSATGSADAIGPRELVAGLDRARALAYKAVADPVEGTILTAVAAAATAASEPLANSVDEVVESARQAANDAVVGTTAQLAQLTRAGVVDGGAKGFALLLDAMAHVISGAELPAPPPLPAQTWQEDTEAEQWEVVLLLEADDDAQTLKAEWATLGSSIVVVSDGSVHKCHVHTDDYNKAIEVARAAGRVSDIAVTELMGGTPLATSTNARVGITGDLAPELLELFGSLDVGTGVAEITIAIPGANVDESSSIQVSGLPQALAAALAHDPDLSIDESRQRMQAAADAVSIATAADLEEARRAVADAGPIEVATVFVGSGLDLDEVAAALEDAAPDVAVEVYPSGRAQPAFEIGLE